ncbi:MAG: PDZ domain-containing protein [Gammaproteobacteria bacterium]|nr:PDZ domain-containing protein [Gammaproteobacteria bacterium]
MTRAHSMTRRVAVLATLIPLAVAAQPPEPSRQAAEPPRQAAEPRPETQPADEPQPAAPPRQAQLQDEGPRPRQAPPGADAPEPPDAAGADGADVLDEQLRRELEQAQQTLEQAARDVARLSAELAEPVVDEVRRQFRIARPRAMLGMSIENGDGGVRVVGVSPNGPAAEAGLRTGDVIVALDGERLDDSGAAPSRQLLGRMRAIEPGDSVSLIVRRDDEERPFDVTAGEPGFFGFERRLRELPDRLRAMPIMPSEAFGNWRTMELVPLTPELGRYFGTEQGLLVVRAPDDDALGLEDGDVILDIGGREPTTPEHAMRILASFVPGETLRVPIMRDRMRRTLELRLPED